MTFRPALRIPVSYATLVLLLLAGLTLVGPTARAQAPASQPVPAVASASLGEMRGVWVTRSWMTSPQRVAQVVDDAARHGMSALFVQVRGRGDAFYSGGPEPRARLLAGQPATYDPLADLVERAAERGLEVHAWINVNLVAGASALPDEPSHVIRRHPEWIMVPRDLAPRLANVAPDVPSYVRAIAEWTRRNAQRVEGLYVSPIPDGAQDHIESVVRHIVRTYPLDGVHLDYIRYPGAEFDYSREALAAFRRSLMGVVPAEELATLDQRAARDPLLFTSRYPQRWLNFRQERLTHLVGRLRNAVRAELPAARITTAVWPDGDDAVGRKMQDWPLWLRSGLVDAVCPMMYTTSPTTFSRQLASLAAYPAGRVWPGIGVYRITAAEAARRVLATRAAGFDGVLLFSYDSMSDGVGRRSAYLTALHREVFATPATPVARALSTSDTASP
jgi:uncharacterized lipoprotein YddW (UPF0748 family)